MAARRVPGSGPISFERLQYGDLVAFYVEDKGFLSTPSSEDPIPVAPDLYRDLEEEDAYRPPLSHLRAAHPMGPGTKLPSDFHNRCIWEVLSEGGMKASDEPVTYGSMIQLRHTKTGFMIMVDSIGGQAPTMLNHPGHENNNNAGGESRIFTRLRSTNRATETSAQFYLRPRYSVRSEGDLVRDHDRIILESCRFKGLQLCLDNDYLGPGGSGGAGLEKTYAVHEDLEGACDGVVSVSDDAYYRSGWQVYLISRARHPTTRSGEITASLALSQHTSQQAAAGATTGVAAAHHGPQEHRTGGLDDGVIICGGDFVRLSHQEIIGHLIARVDDGAERCSKISPLGMVYRKLQQDKDRSVAIFLRRGAAQPSALSIFQVIPQAVASGSPIEWDSPIRLRHLLSGQYLALRLDHPKDSPCIRASARYIMTGGGGGNTGVGRGPTGVTSPAGGHSPAASIAAIPGPIGESGVLHDDDYQSLRMVVATVADPLDPSTFFRFHPVRDSDTAHVMSKSKCILVHHETGAHLSLGSSTIAQHGKSTTRERPGAGAGGALGLSFATVALAARAAAAKKHHGLGGGPASPGGPEDDAGGRSAAPMETYWEYENDSIVHGSCEDNSDAEVYRVYPVKSTATRNLLYALRYRSVIAEAVEVVRGMKLDYRLTSIFGSINQSGEHEGVAPDHPHSPSSSRTPRAGTVDAVRSAAEAPPPPLLAATQFLRNTSRATNYEERYEAACRHLLHALNELILWQAGETEADGEIPRREGVSADDFEGLDDRIRRSRSKTTVRKPNGSVGARGNVMEKDEDSFDRDLTTRRRELLRNCHIVEALLMFVGVSFQLYRGRAYARTRAVSLHASLRGGSGDENDQEDHPFSPVTLPLIDVCCKHAYRLLREVMTSNFALTVLYLAGINSMVRHISLGWDPPIEEILAAAIDQDPNRASASAAGTTGGSSGGGGATNYAATTTAMPTDATTQAQAAGWNQYRLSYADLYQLVLELYGSYMRKEITGTKILKLLANVCAPGNVVDAKVQTFLAGLILQTKRKEGVVSTGEFTLDDLHTLPEVTSLLFSLRPGGAKGGWRVHLSLLQEKPIYKPDREEMTHFTESEKNMIREAFSRYDENNNGEIDKEELGLLLQDLGLQSLMIEEVQSRWTESCSFEQFCEWWHQHRHLLETWSSPFDYSKRDNEDPLLVQTPSTRSSSPTKLQRESSTGSVPDHSPLFGSDPSHIAESGGTDLVDKALQSDEHYTIPTPSSSVGRKKPQRRFLPRSLTVEDTDQAVSQEELMGQRDAIFRRWIDLELLFSHDRFIWEADWIRASARLLVALCRERNLDSQKLVGSIVPVDALLYLLHSNALKPSDKALFCDLLRSCYIEHHLVFPITPLMPKQAVCLSLDFEHIVYGEMGRVFNPLSQVTLALSSLASNPSDQRAGLRAFLMEHLGRLEDNVARQEGGSGASLEAFVTALLRLTKALLLQGFFESDHRKKRMHLEGPHGFTATAAGLLTTFFGKHNHRDYDDDNEDRNRYLEESIFSPSAATDANAVTSPPSNVAAAGKKRGGIFSRLAVTPRLWDSSAAGQSLSGTNARERLTYSSLETSLLVALEAMGKAAERGVGLGCSSSGAVGVDSVQELQLGYDALFDESGPITLKTEILALLRILQEIRSVKNFKSLLWSFNTPSQPQGVLTTLVPDGLGGGKQLTVKDNKLLQLSFSKTQEAVLERGFDDRTGDGEILIDAVLSTTVHRDRQLLIHAYNLLYHHSTQRVSFANLLAELDISRRPSLAITMRLQHLILDLIDKHTEGFLEGSKSACDVLSYGLHSLYRLCYRQWDEPTNAIQQGNALFGGTHSRGMGMTGGARQGSGRHFGDGRPWARGQGGIDIQAVFVRSSDIGEDEEPLPAKAPFISADGLGLDEHMAQPIRAHQEQLQWAAHRVASFVVRALKTQDDAIVAPDEAEVIPHHYPDSHNTPRVPQAGSTPHATQHTTPHGSSSQAQDVLSSLKSPRLIASVTSPRNAVIAGMSAEQKRVIADSFMFMYHSCRGSEELTRSLTVPHVKIVRAHASDFPYAMRLLAELSRQSLKAARVRVKDTIMILNKYVVKAIGGEQMQVEAMGLIRSILESKLEVIEREDDQQQQSFRENDHTAHLLSKASVIEAILDQIFGQAGGSISSHLAFASMGLGSDNLRNKKGGDWVLKTEGLRLVRACLQASVEIQNDKCFKNLAVSIKGTPPQEGKGNDDPFRSTSEQSLSSSSSSTATTKANIPQALRERVAVLFPPAQGLSAAMDPKLAVPIRSVLFDVVRLQIFFPDESTSTQTATLTLAATNGAEKKGGKGLGLPRSSSFLSSVVPAETMEMLQTFLMACQTDLDTLRCLTRAGAVSHKDLNSMAIEPFLFETIPSFLMSYLRLQGCNGDIEESLKSALAAAKRAVEKESSKSRLWKSTEGTVAPKVIKALMVSGGEEVISWINDTFDPSNMIMTESSEKLPMGSTTTTRASRQGEVEGRDTPSPKPGNSRSFRNMSLQQQHQKRSSQQQEETPQQRILAPLLRLIHTLAKIILRTPALQAQWSVCTESWTETFTCLLGFASLCERAQTINISSFALNAATISLAASPAAIGAFTRSLSGGMKNSFAHSTSASAFQQTNTNDMSSTSKVPDSSTNARGDTGGVELSAMSEASRFIVHLAQAFEIRRLAARTAAEEADLIDRQVPGVLEEARAHVLSIFIPRTISNGQSGAPYSFSSLSMKWQDARQWLGLCADDGKGRKRFASSAKRQNVFDGRMLIPILAPPDAIMRRVLLKHFFSFKEFYYEDINDQRDGDSYRLWSRAGGLVIEHILLMIRYRIWEEDDCCLFFLDVISKFLENNLARIRREGAVRYDAQKLIKLVQAEVISTQKKQQAIQALNGHIVLMAIIAQAAHPGLIATKAASLLKIMPRVLQFGTLLMATGNRQVQETIMDYHEKATLELLVQRKFCVGLRNMLRFCRYQIESLMYSLSGPEDPDQIEIILEESQPTLLLMTSLFDFLGSLCAGHNLRARTFLREQRLSGDTVNLVAECSSLVSTTCSYTLSLMSYITNKIFMSKIAPPVHPTLAKKARRFIAWHQNPRKFAHLADMLRILGSGLNSLTEMVQGPCHENQVICERLCSFVGEILEYCGTVHLDLPSIRSHSRFWTGGDPLRFYEMYVKEMARIGEPLSQDEEEEDQILENLKNWRRVGERKLFLNLSFGVKPGGSNSISSKDILGVELAEFNGVCLHMEKSCLKFLTAMLEGQSPGLVDHVRQSIDSFILFQNMDSLVRITAGRAAGTGYTAQELHREKQEAAVLYLTILSTLSSLSQGGDYGAKMTKALEDWQEASAKQGSAGAASVGMLVASVEIVGMDGQVQQVYFAVPQWIKTYWQYPLVQKAKKELAYQVNRASPEEKILDFFDRMAILTKVMRRQELLHKIFSVFHGFVGGKSIDSSLLPNPRSILLLLTILINIWLCADLYYSDNPKRISYVWLKFKDWRNTANLVQGIKILHLAMCISLLFTAALNSGAGDAIRGNHIRIFKRTISFDWLISLVIVLNDVRWLLIMSLLSCIGLWVNQIAYTFCVVDVIPQIRLMKFLLQAITRNGTKIWLTVLLCLVVLYVFSTISYMAFPNMYGFQGYYDCHSLATCFKLHVDYGIANSPQWEGTGAVDPNVQTKLVHSDHEQSTFHFVIVILASIFNLSYVILVNMVLSAIIAGLIIDTFQQMRSENEEIEEDMREKCFICSIDRDLIESAGVSFRDHIKNQHNMWNYFWFRTYLNGKDPLTFTGPENYAFEMYKDKRNLTRFFPLKKSLIIERKNIELKSKNEMDVLIGRVGTLEGQLMKLTNFFEKASDQQITNTNKIAQEQHQLTNNFGEAIELIKATHSLLQQKQEGKDYFKMFRNLGAGGGPIDRERSSDTTSGLSSGGGVGTPTAGGSGRSSEGGMVPKPRIRKLPPAIPHIVTDNAMSHTTANNAGGSGGGGAGNGTRPVYLRSSSGHEAGRSTYRSANMEPPAFISGLPPKKGEKGGVAYTPSAGFSRTGSNRGVAGERGGGSSPMTPSSAGGREEERKSENNSSPANSPSRAVRAGATAFIQGIHSRMTGITRTPPPPSEGGEGTGGGGGSNSK